VLSIPAAKNLLVDSFIDILICDCMAIAATRGLHASTNQFSVWSAVVKYFVPVTIEKTIGNLSSVIGARYYLREGAEGIFQKIVRDNALISLFDGNTAVNLHNIALQLRFLLSERNLATKALTSSEMERIETIFDLSKPLPEFDAKNLELFNHGQDDVLMGLLECRRKLRELCSGAQEGELITAILALAEYAIESLGSLGEKVAKLTADRASTLRNSSDLYCLAREYCVFHAAAACLQMWMYNRKTLAEYFAQGEWLLLALTKLLKPGLYHVSPSAGEKLVQKFSEMHARKEFISLTPFRYC
jgi:hypothetical protein